MRMCYRELVGKHVIDANGKPVGRVADLVAKRWDDALHVTALRVGQSALARRIMFKRTPLGPAQEIPWNQVARVGKQIELRVTTADLGPPEPEDEGDQVA